MTFRSNSRCHRLSVLAITFVLGASACSKILADPKAASEVRASSQVAPPPVPTAADIKSFCEKLAAEACKVITPCCNAAALTTDVRKCTTRAANTCLANSRTSIKDGLGLDQRAAQQCVATYTQRYAHDAGYKNCVERPAADVAKDGLTACEKLWVGRVDQGQPCSVSSQCAPQDDGSTVWCAFSEGAGKTCQVYIAAGVGQPCGEDSAKRNIHCDSSAWCDPGGLCVARGIRGDSCRSGFRSCADPFVCDGKACVDAIPVGGDCRRGGQCGYSSPCDTASRTCMLPKEPAHPIVSEALCTGSHHTEPGK